MLIIWTKHFSTAYVCNYVYVYLQFNFYAGDGPVNMAASPAFKLLYIRKPFIEKRIASSIEIEL